MSPRIGILTRMYCVLMCVVFVCQARVPMDNMLKRKLLAALEGKHRANVAPSTSNSANRIRPEPPSAKTKAEARSGGGKRIRSITPETSSTIKKEGTTADVTAASQSTPVKSKPLDTQNIDVNININNNINNQEPITSATAKPTKPAITKLDKKLCAKLCVLLQIKPHTCDCPTGGLGAWA